MKSHEITGNEFREWYDNHWPSAEGQPDAFHHEDCAVELFDQVGRWAVSPETILDLRELGYVEWQGSGDDPRPGTDQTVETYVRKWRKERDFVILQVECRRDNLRNLEDNIKAAGGKIRR